NADFVITYGELRAMMRSRDLKFEPVEEGYQESSLWGKKFATSKGVAGAVIECMQERGEDTEGIRLLSCAGGSECKKALLLLKAGKLEEDFIEGMICPGGCVGGPSRHKTEAEVTKARAKLLSEADDRRILANLENYPMEKFSMFRDGHLEKQ
nr:ferredoxin [Lachnospiraceae bacterium]